MRKIGDDGMTSSVGQAFVDEVHKRSDRGRPDLGEQAHLVRPALADTDGPFTKFRKWAAQFYAEGVPRRPPRVGATAARHLRDHDGSDRTDREQQIPNDGLSAGQRISIVDPRWGS